MASQEVMTGSLGQRQEKPANIFYHYTNMDGLLGIVGNAELWATDVRYLNDTSEFKFGTDMLREKMQEAVDRNGQASEALDRFELFVTQMRLPAYVTSFSAEPTGDDLSQWRAYGGAHSGFSLGFSRKYLTDVGTNFVAADGWARKGKNISIPFLACVYIDDENTSANHMVADRLLRNRSKEDPTDSAYLFAVNAAG